MHPFTFAAAERGMRRTIGQPIEQEVRTPLTSICRGSVARQVVMSICRGFVATFRFHVFLCCTTCCGLAVDFVADFSHSSEYTTSPQKLYSKWGLSLTEKQCNYHKRPSSRRMNAVWLDFRTSAPPTARWEVAVLCCDSGMWRHGTMRPCQYAA